jgi:hypothetical protein
MHPIGGMRSELKELLIRQNLVSREQVDWATQTTQGSGCTWLEQLLLHGLVDEERVCEHASAQACVPRADLQRLGNIGPDVVARLPADVAVEHRVMPLGLESDGDLRVGLVDPLDAATVDEVQFFAGRRVLREALAASAVAWALHRYHGVASALYPRAPRRRSLSLVGSSPRHSRPVAQLGTESAPILLTSQHRLRAVR